MLLGSRPVTWSRGMSEEEDKWKATGNKLEEKTIGFAYEFYKEERRRMVGSFPSSLAFHCEPRTCTQFVEASEK